MENDTETKKRSTDSDHDFRCCANCVWHDVDGLYEFYGKNAEGIGDLGFCRRMPPVPGVWRLGDGNLPNGRVEHFVFAEWPETQEDDFCGEWAKEFPT